MSEEDILFGGIGCPGHQLHQALCLIEFTWGVLLRCPAGGGNFNAEPQCVDLGDVLRGICHDLEPPVRGEFQQASFLKPQQAITDRRAGEPQSFTELMDAVPGSGHDLTGGHRPADVVHDLIGQCWLRVFSHERSIPHPLSWLKPIGGGVAKHSGDAYRRRGGGQLGWGERSPGVEE